MSTFALIAAVFATSLLFNAVFFCLGLRWVKAPRAKFGVALTLVLLMFIVTSATLLAQYGVARIDTSPDGLAAPLAGLIIFAAALLSHCLVIKFVSGTTFWRSVGVWLVSVVGQGLAVVVVLLAVKPFLLEAYVTPSNNMAPSVVGWHLTGVCPQCGGDLMLAGASPQEPPEFAPRPDRPGICSACGQYGKSPTHPSTVLGPDRILCNKILKPKRWDIIVFRYPPKPDVKYLDRLVGLPGETVFIDEGAIWIDGVKTPLPESVGRWKYDTTYGKDYKTPMGDRERPWQLGPDECVVLGDSTWYSSDSREWGVVPVANIEGVVTLTYWPMERWKVWR